MKYTLYSLLLEAESIPGPQCGWKDCVKNSNDTIGNRTRDIPSCNIVPQLTAPPRAPHACINVLISSTCFEHPTVHPQEDLYMQFYGISIVHPYKHSGRRQGVFDTKVFMVWAGATYQ